MSTTSAHGSEGPVAELGKVAGEHRPRSPGTWEAGLTRGPSLKLNTDTHTHSREEFPGVAEPMNWTRLEGSVLAKPAQGAWRWQG